jgi:acetyl-CoA C-acetyltransferase
VHRRGSLSEFPAIVNSSKKALQQAGRKIEDIDVAEIYGAFAGSELITYEDLGFFKKGEAGKAVWKGQTKIGGQIPINPSGGRLSLGHPPFVTPILEIIELVCQLRGEAGERQVKGAKIGLAQAEHGVLDGSAVAILEAPAH